MFVNCNSNGSGSRGLFDELYRNLLEGVKNTKNIMQDSRCLEI
jgi:hypothetical protein